MSPLTKIRYGHNVKHAPVPDQQHSSPGASHMHEGQPAHQIKSVISPTISNSFPSAFLVQLCAPSHPTTYLHRTTSSCAASRPAGRPGVLGSSSARLLRNSPSRRLLST